MSGPGLRFKIASEPTEFEQIHRLNYRTFVEEIPQHDPSEEAALVDKFHEENTYVIALRGERLVGMVCVRGRRPFSLDAKLDDLDGYLPSGSSVCEFRLLAVEPDQRRGPVFSGLVEHLGRHALERGWDVGVISGTVRQLRLYRHLGFEPFGPRVGGPEAEYQPMMLTLERFRGFLDDARGFADVREALPPGSRPRSFLPGPVEIVPPARAAFERAPTSHRSPGFVTEMEELRDSLARLTNARHAEVLLGSGTLANDVVAAQISLLDTAGAVLSNGEFGDRLVDHARRFGLEMSVVDEPWGRPFLPDVLERTVRDLPRGGWLWAVHCETSTGVLNDVDLMKGLCRDRGVHLCLDCISSIGLVPVDLAGVAFATGVSGKAMGAHPGLSFVVHDAPASSGPDRLPRYLDLGLYAERGSVPFTHSSNLVRSLRAALERLSEHSRFDEIRRCSGRVRRLLRGSGFRVLAPDAHAAPGVITVPLPPSVDSGQVGRRLEGRGFLISHASDYLLRRNWIQVCLMGQVSEIDCERVVAALREECGEA